MKIRWEPKNKFKDIELLSELRARFSCFDEEEEPYYRALSNAIVALRLKSERNKGKWIDENCSVCGHYVYHGDSRNFCPNCGAKMEID